MRGQTIPIGNRVKQRRRQLGLTQQAVARSVDISVSYLSLIEHNKRPIGGRVLRRLAAALDLDLDTLSDVSDTRVAQELTAALSDTLFEREDLGDDPAQRLVGFDPALARAVLALYRAYIQGQQQVDTLSNRLHQDPVLLEMSHQILSRITAVRSMSELLLDVDDIPADRQRRFFNSLAQESGNLGELVGVLLDVLTSGSGERPSTNPVDEVDDFIVDHGNYFPDLEEAADHLRWRLEPDSALTGPALADALARDHGVDVVYEADQAVHQSGYRFDSDTRRLLLFERMPEPSVRFQMARLLARLRLGDVLQDTVDDPRLTSEEARRRAIQAMESYIAGALVFPYDAFHASALQFRYDVELLIQRFGGSFEQICHRLVTLRRPGREGIPFAFLRVDPAGNISKRFSLPGLRLPKYRESCAHWAVFQALGTPDRIVAQRASLPTGTEFLMVARSVTKQAAAFGAPRTRFGVMIACEAVYRDQIVYGDGFVGDAPSLSTPVGVTCRLCHRRNCQQRAHPAIV